MKKQKIAKIAVGLALVTPLLAAYYWGIGDHISVACLKTNKEMLHAFVSEHYLLSIFYYIVVYILVGALSFPFASLVTLSGGFLFGTLMGTIYTNIGATLGGMVAFLSYRYLFGGWVREHYSHYLVRFNNEIELHGAWYLIMIRLIAVIPFFVANALASVAPISLKTFLWTTSVGIIPASLIYSFAGEQLDTINSLRDVFSAKVIGAFALLALLTWLSILVRHVRVKKNRE